MSTVAFVLGGGGSLGAAQVGALAALTEARIVPDLVVGSSVGALNGALFSAGGATREAVEPLRHLWLSLRRRDVFPLRAGPVIAALVGRRDSFVSSRRLSGLIDSRLRHRRLEDLPVAFCAVATDLETGEAVALGQGDVRPALLASTAFPGVFEPVTVDGRQLVDGGVAASLPLSVAAALGAQTIVGQPTPSFHRSRPRGAVALMQRASDQLTERVTRHDVALAAEVAEVHIVTQLPSSVSMFDFNSTETLLKEGYEAALDWLGGSPLTAARLAGSAESATSRIGERVDLPDPEGELDDPEMRAAS